MVALTILDRVAELRRKLTLEDFMFIVGIMYANDLIEMLLRHLNSILRDVVGAL